MAVQLQLVHCWLQNGLLSVVGLQWAKAGYQSASAIVLVTMTHTSYHDPTSHPESNLTFPVYSEELCDCCGIVVNRDHYHSGNVLPDTYALS